MEGASLPGESSLEGEWHQAVRTNYAWKFTLYYWTVWVVCWIFGEWFKAWYYSSNGIISDLSPLQSFIIDVSVIVFILPFTLWLDRNKVPAMLKFDDAGIRMQLKNGLVVEAGWNLVKSVKFHRSWKLTTIRFKGIVSPYTSQFPPEVTGALIAKLAGMRQHPTQPTAPTLEDQVDSRLEAITRM